jgi:D-alanyl-D-alanine carboxypeptidase/D-alanyl-D-alanine-endopeptidase (penicillin-binding protein 4)
MISTPCRVGRRGVTRSTVPTVGVTRRQTDPVPRVSTLAAAVLLVAVGVVPAAWTVRVDGRASRLEADALALRSPILAASAGDPVTVERPLLRAERAPEALLRPVLDRRLATELTPVVASWPDPYCLDVHLDGRHVFRAGETAQIPASVQKLVTATAVLAVIDPDERLTTVARSDALRRESGDGSSAVVLGGDLWIVGGGDPLITTAAYSDAYPRQPQLRTPIEELASSIASTGVTVIEGRLMGDESRYDAERYVATWPDRYRDQHNSGPLSALTVNDGFTSWDPVRVDAPDPARHFLEVLAGELGRQGVRVVGGIGTGTAPAGGEVLAVLESPPILEIVQAMLRESDNNTAEMLVKELGLRERGVGATGPGAEAVVAIVSQLFPAETPPVVMDGSGLDRGNQLTCSLLTALLDHHGPGSGLASGLPVANRTGTLAHRFVDDPAAGRLAAKTGLLNNVNALAGFVDNDGGVVTFAQLLNGIPLPGTLGFELQGELVAALLRHPGGLDAEDVLNAGSTVADEGEDEDR